MRFSLSSGARNAGMRRIVSLSLHARATHQTLSGRTELETCLGQLSSQGIAPPAVGIYCIEYGTIEIGGPLEVGIHAGRSAVDDKHIFPSEITIEKSQLKNHILSRPELKRPVCHSVGFVLNTRGSQVVGGKNYDRKMCFSGRLKKLLKQRLSRSKCLRQHNGFDIVSFQKCANQL
jgi:hypothetical protein